MNRVGSSQYLRLSASSAEKGLCLIRVSSVFNPWLKILPLPRPSAGQSRWLEGLGLAEIFHRQPAAFDDALERADGDGFGSMHGHNDLMAAGAPPFLVAAPLGIAHKTSLAQYADDVVCVADWKALAQGRATSRSFAFLGRSMGAGSNHNTRASRALATASSSVSPAVAQPGNSGNTADHRPVSQSCSTKSRNFMPGIILLKPPINNLSPEFFHREVCRCSDGPHRRARRPHRKRKRTEPEQRGL